MKIFPKISLFIILTISIAGSIIACSGNKKISTDNRFLTYVADPKSQDIAFYWKNDSNKIIGSFQNLKTYLEHNNKELIFAANGGMFDTSFSPQGLFIQDSKLIVPLDTVSGKGNFYLKPNGVFYLTRDNIPFVCKTEDFKQSDKIRYATQSGPMLLIDGEIHSAFKQGSSNLHIRNGVGVLPDGKVVFVMSKVKVNFYDLASYFRSLGCRDALYLDGYVSRAYLPKQDWLQTDGNFGVIIGVTSK